MASRLPVTKSRPRYSEKSHGISFLFLTVQFDLTVEMLQISCVLLICNAEASEIVRVCVCAWQVTDVAFAEDSSMFVTVGNRHVKFWYLDASKSKVGNLNHCCMQF